MRLGAFFALALTAYGQAPVLTADDVQSVISKAAASINSKAAVIAVTDRQGNILGLYRKPDAGAVYL